MNSPDTRLPTPERPGSASGGRNPQTSTTSADAGSQRLRRRACRRRRRCRRTHAVPALRGCGGALVNLDGQVVGIPTLAATDPELGGSAPGIGFAIPSATVTDMASQIVRHGHVVAA